MIEHPGITKMKNFNRIIQKDYSIKEDKETCYRYVLSYNKEVIRRFFNINVLIEYYNNLIEAMEINEIIYLIGLGCGMISCERMLFHFFYL